MLFIDVIDVIDVNNKRGDEDAKAKKIFTAHAPSCFGYFARFQKFWTF